MRCDARCRTNVGTVFETLVENGECAKVIPDAACSAPRFCPMFSASSDGRIGSPTRMHTDRVAPGRGLR